MTGQHTPSMPERFEPWHTLTALRQRSGLSKKRLSEVAGCSRTYLRALEAGTRWPGSNITRRLAEALDVPVGAIRRIGDGRLGTEQCIASAPRH